MISPITGHIVWNITFFFVYSDLMIRITNIFSLFCTLLCCSSNYYVLGIARWNGFTSDVSIPVVARTKAWVCRRSLVGIKGSNIIEVMDACLL
jgi:hypothetical protein